jgi:multidrug efflux system outer membrane protein
MRVLLLLPMLSACALHQPTAQRLIVPDLPAPVVDQPADGQSPWWSVLNDPALPSLIAEAQNGSPDLRAFAAQLRAAEAVAGATRGARFPSLSFATSTAGQPYTPFVIPLPGAESDPDTEVQLTLQTQFNLAYEADLFGRLSSNSAAAYQDANAAKFDLKAMRLVTTAQVLEMVLTVLEGRQQLALLASNEALLRHQLGNVQERYRAGLSNLLELRQSEEMIATAVAQRPLLKEQVLAAGRRLALLSGRHAQQPVFPELDALPALPAVWSYQVSAGVVHRRPDVASAFARVHAADHRVAAAIASRLPSLRFNSAAGFLFMGRSEPQLGLGESLQNSIDSVADSPTDNLAWTLSAQLLAPIYQGGAIKARIGAAKARREAVIERYRKTVLIAFQEMVAGVSGEAAQRAYLQRLSEQRAALASSLDAARVRYTSGLTEYRVLLQTQLAMLRADQAIIRAKRQVWSARIRLLRAAAGSLSETKP